MQIGMMGLGRMDGNVSPSPVAFECYENISIATTATASRATGHNGKGCEARPCDLDNCLRQRTKGTKQNSDALKHVGASDSAPFFARRRVFRWSSSPIRLCGAGAYRSRLVDDHVRIVNQLT
jgi:hypothetical protein